MFGAAVYAQVMAWPFNSAFRHFFLPAECLTCLPPICRWSSTSPRTPPARPARPNPNVFSSAAATPIAQRQTRPPSKTARQGQGQLQIHQHPACQCYLWLPTVQGGDDKGCILITTKSPYTNDDQPDPSRQHQYVFANIFLHFPVSKRSLTAAHSFLIVGKLVGRGERFLSGHARLPA